MKPKNTSLLPDSLTSHQLKMNMSKVKYGIRPHYLKEGDKIMLAAPARFASPALIQEAASVVRAAGFTPVIPSGLEARDHQFSGDANFKGGSDAHRAAIINSAFRDKSVRAIWALRGGYGCGRILPLLEIGTYLDDPTWIIGFSDVTALLSWSVNQGIACLHAPVASTFASTNETHIREFWKTLKGELEVIPNIPKVKIVGGNLSVLYSLLGTPYFPKVENCYILIEDLDEYLYHIDRMLLAFKLAGVFEKADGLIVGTFSDLRDNTIRDGQTSDNPFGLSIEQIISAHVPENYPVTFNNPMGHGEMNYPVVFG